MPIVIVLMLKGKTQVLRFPYKFQYKKVWQTFECVKLCKFGKFLELQACLEATHDEIHVQPF